MTVAGTFKSHDSGHQGNIEIGSPHLTVSISSVDDYQIVNAIHFINKTCKLVCHVAVPTTNLMLYLWISPG